MRVTFPCILAIGLLATAIFPTQARAADVSVVAGRSATFNGRWTNTAFINVAADKTYTWHGLHFQPVGTVGWVGGRYSDYEKANDLDDDVFVAGGGLRLVNWWHGAFASFQVGVAAGRTDALSSGGQFISSLGWQGDHWMVMVRHISNGDFFTGRNLGETMLVAGVRF